MKLSFGAVLIIIQVLVVACLLSFFWILLSPRWSFTIATDKTSYSAGELIEITVILKNDGYMTQRITSACADPVMLWIEFSPMAYVFFSDIHQNLTTFTVTPGQALTRTWIWNQTWWDNTRGYPGTYAIQAAIPEPHLDHTIADVANDYGRMFYAYTEINITVT